MADINVSSPGSDEASLRTAFQAILKNWRVVAASGVAVPLTGTTSETTLATISIPAGAMGANGILRVTTMWSYTNSANNKNLGVRLGGLSGTVFMRVVATTTTQARHQREIVNRNSQSSQIGFVSANVTSFNAASTTNPTGTVNTATAQDLVITGELASAAENITLEYYLVELLYQA